MSIAASSRSWLPLAGALVVLNSLLTFHNQWPTSSIRFGWQLSIEITVTILLLALAAVRTGAPRRWSLVVLSMAIMLLALGRYGEVTARALYGRPLNLYYDVAHVPNLIAMGAQTLSPGVLWAIGLGAIVFLVLLYALVRGALACVARALAIRTQRSALGGIAGVLTIGYLAGSIGAAPALSRPFAEPVLPTWLHQARLLAHAVRGAPSIAGESPSPFTNTRLDRLDGADVFLMFVESYGAAALDRPEYREALAPVREALASAVAASGRHIVSAFVTSPTFGGRSTFAHISLLAGTEVRDAHAYNLLSTQRRDTLVHAFARNGYRTVGLMPGLRQVWSERGFYSYDEIYDVSRLDYKGPAFGWWSIPDQFSLAVLERSEVATAVRSPLLVVFAAISSHGPFRPTPPYLDDWTRFRTEQPFTADELSASFAQRVEWGNLGPGYVQALGYTLRSVAGYVEQRRGRDALFIILGDHQPPAGLAGEGASWEVPVHIIASRAGLLAPLLDQGFVRGVVPTRPALGPMHALAPFLFRSFSEAGTQRFASPPAVP